MKDVPPHTVDAVERSGRARLRSRLLADQLPRLVNLRPGPMHDLRVRRALNHAVDVDE